MAYFSSAQRLPDDSKPLILVIDVEEKFEVDHSQELMVGSFVPTLNCIYDSSGYFFTGISSGLPELLLIFVL